MAFYSVHDHVIFRGNSIHYKHGHKSGIVISVGHKNMKVYSDQLRYTVTTYDDEVIRAAIRSVDQPGRKGYEESAP